MTLRSTLPLAAAVFAVVTAAQLPVFTLLANGGAAQIVLVGASATLAHTSDTTWSLTKSGALTGNTVTWDIPPRRPRRRPAFFRCRGR